MKVLIEIPTWLGDTVMSSPSIEKILDHFKGSEIYSLSFNRSQNIFQHHPLFHGHLKIPKSYRGLYGKVIALGKFDLFISFRNSFRSKIIGKILRAKRIFFFNGKRYPNCHQVEKYEKFISEITGVKSIASELKIYKNKAVKIEKYVNSVGINPGAAYGESKCWPPEYFVQLIEKLTKDSHVVIFGPKNDFRLSQIIESNLKKKKIKNYTNLSGKTSIDELIEIISKLKLFITGDSGPMHIAAAFQVPTIAIFGSTRIEETSQWKNQLTVNLVKKLSCQPCMKRSCPLGHHDCMKLISPDEVYKRVLKLI